MARYFATDEKDIKFDDFIRDAVKQSGKKSHMALYLQGQEELNILRELIDAKRTMDDDLRTIHTVIEKSPELKESDNLDFCSEEAYLQIMDSLAGINHKIDDLMEYLCEADNNDPPDVLNELAKDAEAYARMKSIRAFKRYSDGKDEASKKMVDIWDYILCCVKFCNNLEG